MNMVYIDTVGESDLHVQLQNGLTQFFKNAIQSLAGSVGEPDIRQRIQDIKLKGSARLNIAGSLLASPDFSFIEDVPGLRLPSLIGEIC